LIETTGKGERRIGPLEVDNREARDMAIEVYKKLQINIEEPPPLPSQFDKLYSEKSALLNQGRPGRQIEMNELK
jgi:hypothetical protein